MQKIRNRSLFFQKISHIRYIAKNFESVQALSGILPKILKTVPLFWKKSAHRVYCQKFWKRSRFSELFSKNLSTASSGRPDIGISTILYAPIRQIRQISPLPGLFPKSPSTVPFLSNFFKKFLSLHCWLSLFCLEKVTPVQKIFQKKTPHCWLSHFFCVLFLHSWKKVEKSYRSGIKSWWQAITNNNLPEREY